MTIRCKDVLVIVGAVFYGLLLIAATVLQFVGFFSRKWVLVASCDVGINVICCGKDTNEVCFWDKTHGIQQATYGLEVSAMVFLGLGLFLVICSILTTDPTYAVGAPIFCCPISGLLSVIGCIVFATQASDLTLGYSYYVTLAAGCCNIVATLSICVAGCCIACFVDDDDVTDSQRRGVAPAINLSHI